MANALRSDFLGKALQRSEMSSAKVAERVQTQALFNKKTTKTATKQVKKVEQKAKSAVPQLKKAVPQLKKAVPQLKKAAPQLQKKATQVQKSVTKQAKKATSGKATKGWFGGTGGASDLDKWYGEYMDRSCLRIDFICIEAECAVPGRRPIARSIPPRRPPGPF